MKDKVRYTNVRKYWLNSEKLVCPCLRSYSPSIWVAINEEPCSTRKCKRRTCHNYGDKFKDRKLIIVRWK